MAINSTFKVPPNPTGVYTISVGTGGGGGTSFGDINKKPPHMITDSTFTQKVVDHRIIGQTIMAEYRMNIDTGIHASDDTVKEILMRELIKQMFEAKHIEFTQMRKVDTDEMVYRARIHVVPDTQVRIIREIKDA